MDRSATDMQSLLVLRIVGIATLIVLLLFALGFTGWVRASEALGSVFGLLRYR